MKEQSQPSCCRRLLTKLGEDVAEFAEHTSAHGLPRAYVSRGLRRALWLLLFFACLCVFGYQAYLIMDRFSRNDIIVGVELKFEAMRFPAVTLCNINAYKNSPSRQFSSVKSAIEAFEFALDSQSPRKKRSIDNLMDVDISDIQSVRLKCSLNPDGLYRPDLEGGQDCHKDHSMITPSPRKIAIFRPARHSVILMKTTTMFYPLGTVHPVSCGSRKSVYFRKSTKADAKSKFCLDVYASSVIITA
ncbi:hypothetical protein WR25_13953 [Diploscapter pachys]|uniref:Uncharacterized protein n=1 Tax=Diploscapter pachys TaxID=2018661 RepID=A0A2A2J8D4_9BILA|nr:hypothetical protein WR25_13953 [Diploscapter pachys]